VNALRLSGATCHVISLRHGKIRGVNLHEPASRLHVHATIAETDPDDYDGLLIPGGFINPGLLRQSAEARDFVRAFDDARKPIATLCHGPWVPASAGLLQGRTMTSWRLERRARRSRQRRRRLARPGARARREPASSASLTPTFSGNRRASRKTMRIATSRLPRTLRARIVRRSGPLFEPPRLRGADEGERPTAWLEFFFDLFFVVAVDQLVRRLQHGVTGHETLVYLALYAPVWWAWVGFVVYTTGTRRPLQVVHVIMPV